MFRACGHEKERQAIKEIKETAKSLKTPIQKARIEAIIQKHAKHPEAPKKVGYKTLYLAEVKQHGITKDQYKDALQELKAARKQIEKLKATVLELKPLRGMKEAILPFIVPEEKQAEHRVS